MSSLASPTGATVVAVSSALPSEGKTVLSTLIAMAMSSEGNKVLVVDADLRNPRIHKVFGTDRNFPGKGLSDLLSEDSMSVEELICDTGYPGLSFIPAGLATSNPLPLLKSERLKTTLDQCKEMFDFVIVDSPPIIGLSDSRVLSGVVDGIILVAKEGHAPLVTIRQAARMVGIANGKILGLVISMSASGPMGHY
jgi:capsular exopolysaccharide synthesis family protein